MKLLAEAGFAGGFDAGFYWCDLSYANLGEAVVNELANVGIRLKLRPLERAAYNKGFEEKRFKKASSRPPVLPWAMRRLHRIALSALSNSPYAYGGYPEIDALFQRQLHETTSRSGERCCMRSSGSCTKRICSFLYGNLVFCAPPVRGAELDFGGAYPVLSTRRHSRISRSPRSRLRGTSPPRTVVTCAVRNTTRRFAPWVGHSARRRRSPNPVLRT